jgi:DNA-binding CsgD family transcriptional regulator
VVIIGRDDELRELHDFIDRLRIQGQPLLLSGEAGVGKTILLDAAARYARAQGYRVVHAAGVEFEADVSYAALHLVLQPLLGELENLTTWYRDALTTALGLREGARSDQLVLTNALLALLAAAASSAPLLLIVDDLPWIDRASSAVLGFVARRLGQLPVGLLTASRTDEKSFLGQVGLPTRHVPPLTDAAASALLASRYPAMSPRVRQRLLTQAQGNPLALLELPAALLERTAATEAGSPLPAVLPLSGRLQATFAARVRPLPGQTRHLLLAAVLDGTGDLAILDAVAGSHTADALASAAGALAPAADALAPAERAGLIRVGHGGGRVTFRHPLIRSAVVELAAADERRAVHRILAAHHGGQAARRAWHLAQAATGPDEDVAALLQSVAHLNLWRGDSVGAIGELLRAAELSPAGADRARRLAEAAYLGETVTGDMHDVAPLLDQARHADPAHAGGLAGAAAHAYYLLNSHGDIDAAHQMLVRAIGTLDDPADAGNKVLVETLHTLLQTCYFGGRAQLWEPCILALSRLRPRPPERIALAASTLSDPVRRAPPVLRQLDAAIAGQDRETSPARIVRTGTAALYVDRLPRYRDPLWRAVQHGREGGAVTSAIEALMLLSADGWLTGTWDDVLAMSAEASALSEEHGYPLLARMALSCRVLVAAARGERDTTLALTSQLASWAGPRRALIVTQRVYHARALDAAGRGDFEGAYENAAAIAPPGTLDHTPQGLWVLFDLVEAAMRTRRHDAAQAHVRAMLDADVASLSPRLALLVAGAAALLDDATNNATNNATNHATDNATDGATNNAFERALAVPDAASWPFDLARVHLAYGERLRRGRVTGAARRHLSAAREIFGQLGAAPWVARAAGELRATGQPTGDDERQDSVTLTPQQQEIAALAAAGLTNKQIGERLYLSHRTVATHLYRIFPKLGVTSRAALRDALSGNDHQQ